VLWEYRPVNQGCGPQSAAWRMEAGRSAVK
jgi:hypothetical protein